MNRAEKERYVDSDAYNQAINEAAMRVSARRSQKEVAEKRTIDFLDAIEELIDEEDQKRREAVALKLSFNAYQMAAPHSRVAHVALKYIKAYPSQSISDAWNENHAMLEKQEEALEELFFTDNIDEEELIKKAGTLKFEYDNLERMREENPDMPIFRAINPN